MTETKKEPTYQPISFDAIKIGLASPEKIMATNRFDKPIESEYIKIGRASCRERV